MSAGSGLAEEPVLRGESRPRWPLTGDPERRSERALAAAETNLQAGAFDAARSLVATAESGPLDELQRGRVELLRV